MTLLTCPTETLIITRTKGLPSGAVLYFGAKRPTSAEHLIVLRKPDGDMADWQVEAT